MKILEFLDEGILLLNIGIVVIGVIRLLYGQLKLTYILKTKGGYIEKYRLNAMKYFMAGLAGVGVLAGIIEVFLLCKENLNLVQKVQSLGQAELLLWIIAFFGAVYIFFMCFACLYIGVILTDDELIVRGFIKIQRISYDEIREQAKLCKPVLKPGKLVLLLERKIVKLNVMMLNPEYGFKFSNRLMKKCNIPAFPRGIYMEVMEQRKPKYEEQYAKMKRIYKSRKRGQSYPKEEEITAIAQDMHNTYVTTEWEDASISTRLLAIRTMIVSLDFLGVIIGVLFGIFITILLVVGVIDRFVIEELGIPEISLWVIAILVMLGGCAIFLIGYLKQIYKLLFGHTKCCTAKIDYVFVSYRRNSSGTQKRYRITFAHGEDGAKETKTVDYDRYVRNFNPVRYEGEYISVITADMEYFVLRKKYKVKRRRWT